MNTDTLITLGSAVLLYLALGAILMLRADASRRWYRLLDWLSPATQLLTVLFWPVALPFVMVRYGRHRY